MSIVAECPHCETRFNLQPDLIGKSMRCPNIDCRQVFTVQPAQSAAPKPPAAPRNPTGRVDDFVPVIDAEPVAPPVVEAKVVAPPPKPPKKERPKPRPTKKEAQVVEATVVAPPPAREVVWSADAAPPPPGGQDRPQPLTPDHADEPFEPIVRRKKKSNRGPYILIGMLVLTACLGFGAIVYLFKQQAQTEAAQADEAKAQYEGGEYAAAAKSFEKLAADYPESEEAPRYRFFADLANMRLATAAVTNREDPEPALRKLRAFIDAQKDSPLARPKSGYGRDIREAGKKLGEDIVLHVEDRVKAFQADRTRSGELDRAERMIAAGRELVPVLEAFRDVEDAPLTKITEGLDRAEAAVRFERHRLAVLGRLLPLLDKPTDAVIQQVVAEAKEQGLGDDPELLDRVAKARGRLRELIRYEADPAAPRAPAPAAASLLFVAPIGPTRPSREPFAEGDPPAVFLAVARGVLYALDEETGNLLWATRVGPDTFDPPAIATVDLPEGRAELAVVTSNVAGEPGLAGFMLRTGQPRWFQPLPAPAAGPAAVVGSRAFVVLRDPDGTVFEFDLVTGERVGRIRLGQPAGPAAVVRPGTGLLYAAADARRVYVLDVGSRDDEGHRVNPRCVQVIATNHPPGTLRTAPIILGPDGTGPGDRWLVLAQSDGPSATKLRAFPLPPVQPSAPEGPPPAESPAATDAELPLSGWVWFPPVSDGERLAVVTDDGRFRLFGVNQPGNADRAVFPFPGQGGAPAPAGTPVPGLAVPAEEAAFWVLAGGSLRKHRLALHPVRGLDLVPEGNPAPVGVPTQPAQLNRRRDAACLVVRSANSAGVRAIVVDLHDGATRWKRQLGIIPSVAPLGAGENLVLVDEDGGVVTVPADGLGVTAIEPGPEDVTGPTAVAASADGKAVFTVTPVGGEGAGRFVVRRLEGGAVVHTGTVPAPAPLAGRPAVMGQTLLLPTADGFVYRHLPGDGKLVSDRLAPGPRWLEDRRDPDAVCFLTPVSDTAFLTSNGGRVLTRWSWPSSAGWTPGGATWEVRERVAIPPLWLPPTGTGAPARLLVADVTGSVWLYPADRGGQPLRRWRSGGTSPVPAGRPTGRFALQSDPNGRQLIVYTVEGRHVAGLDPDRETPLWVFHTPDDPGGELVGSPQPTADRGWVVTDLAGRVAVLDAESGARRFGAAVGLPGAVPATAGVAAGPGRVLCPLSDGSAVVVTPPETVPDPGNEKE